MKRKRKPYTVYQLASAIFMILALLWLTISIPFVYASQQQLAKQGKMVNSTSPFAGSEEETAKTHSNTTEGKTSNSNSFSEEYLHDLHVEEYYISIASQYHKGENASAYIAYHGELLVPPPNVI